MPKPKRVARCHAPLHRYKLGVSSVLGIICGTREKEVKLNMSPFLAIIQDELAHIAEHGHRVYDSHKQDYFTVVARLVQIMSDYRGIKKCLQISGSPCKYACYK
jgi:hypothetical protein